MARQVLPQLHGLVVAATGHRPDKLGGYSEDTFYQLVTLANLVIKETKPRRTISGMAQGWDMAWAFASIKAGIPCVAAIPFEGQESIWPSEAQRMYREILGKCSQVQIISEGTYQPIKMQIRNEWMVDNCDHLIALWKGTAGGTANCVQYARKEKTPWTNVWPLWLQTKSSPKPVPMKITKPVPRVAQ